MKQNFYFVLRLLFAALLLPAAGAAKLPAKGICIE